MGRDAALPLFRGSRQSVYRLNCHREINNWKHIRPAKNDVQTFGRKGVALFAKYSRLKGNNAGHKQVEASIILAFGMNRNYYPDLFSQGLALWGVNLWSMVNIFSL